MKKTIWILLTTVIFMSCSDNTDVTHFSFTSNDLQYIPTGYQNVGEIIKFKNENNQELSFEVLSYNLAELETYLPYHLIRDVLNIRIKMLNDSNCNTTTFTLDISKNTENKLHIYIYKCDGELAFINSPSTKNVQTMILNDIVYNKVIELNPVFPVLAYQNPPFDLNPKIFYDLKKGFIGFNERDNIDNYRIVSD
tara:strand:+ start:27687 stop:28271 length:585 start_codon:yes stop_codon:yes gene_type:complete